MAISDKALKKRAKERVGFKWHFAVYIIVNAFLAVFNYVSTPGSWWFYWTTIPWGLGIAIHYVAAYHLGEGAEEAEFQKLKAQQKK
jgi:hypothetical protein